MGEHGEDDATLAWVFRDVVPTDDVPGPRPARRPYDPRRHKDYVRAGLTIGLLGLLATMLVVPLLALIAGWAAWDELEAFVTLTWGAVVGLVASSVGYYFGSERRKA